MYPEDTVIDSECMHTDSRPQIHKVKTIKLNRETDKSTIAVEDFNTHHSAMNH
jgi:hypothetical protein